jgi:hypothetical protein
VKSNKEPARAGSAMQGAFNTQVDPFYDTNVMQRGFDATPRTQASAGLEKKVVVAKNLKSGLKMESTEQELLEHIHKLRLQQFDARANDPLNEKPYLPMLSSDEKEVIMEQYYSSKKKLNKV